MMGSEAPILQRACSGSAALRILEGNMSLPDDGAKYVERAEESMKPL